MGTMPYPKGYVAIGKHVSLSETCMSHFGLYTNR